jgi:hypothetical protein
MDGNALNRPGAKPVTTVRNARSLGIGDSIA